jgi:hypothetical protein
MRFGIVARWQLQDAKARFSQVVKSAVAGCSRRAGGPFQPWAACSPQPREVMACGWSPAIPPTSVSLAST